MRSLSFLLDRRQTRRGRHFFFSLAFLKSFLGYKTLDFTPPKILYKFKLFHCVENPSLLLEMCKTNTI